MSKKEKGNKAAGKTTLINTGLTITDVKELLQKDVRGIIQEEIRGLMHSQSDEAPGSSGLSDLGKQT